MRVKKLYQIHIQLGVLLKVSIRLHRSAHVYTGRNRFQFNIPFRISETLIWPSQLFIYRLILRFNCTKPIHSAMFTLFPYKLLFRSQFHLENQLNKEPLFTRSSPVLQFPLLTFPLVSQKKINDISPRNSSFSPYETFITKLKFPSLCKFNETWTYN